MRKRPLCTLCLLFLIIQAVRVALSSAQPPEPSALEKTVAEWDSVTLEGTVTAVQNKEKVTAVFLEDCLISTFSGDFNEKKLLIYIKTDSEIWIGPDSQKQILKKENLHMAGIKIGNQVRVSGEAEIFEQARNPGNFDQKSYYARQGIYLLVWADKVEILSLETDKIRQFLAEVRFSWKELLTRYLGEYYGGTMSAVLLGEKSGLDAEMKKLYQKNGIGHLLAISGLHMSFIGMGVYGILRRTGIGFLFSGLAGGILLILYTLMIGAGVSSLRALIMFLVRIGADVTGRDYDLPTSLALSAAVTCAGQPFYLTDAGFLLSYGAILGIILLGPVFEGMFHIGKKKSKILESFGVSLAVNVMLLGPVLYFYFEAPPYSVILNLLVIPMMPVAMGAGMIGSALLTVWELPGSLILKVCKAVLWGYDCICSGASELPGSRFVSGRPQPAWLVVYYAGIGILCAVFYVMRERNMQRFEEGQKGQRTLLRIPGGCLLVFAVTMAAFCRLGYHMGDGIQATVLDVGQGDCIHIRGETGDYLVDGGSSDVSLAGTYRIEPYLLASAVDTLDYVFATHGDEDHINGIRELLEGQRLGVSIRTLVLPPKEYCDEKLIDLARTAMENGTRVTSAGTGDEIREKGARDGAAAESGHLEKRLSLTCLGPAKGADMELGNEASLVLSLTYGDFSMLLTGDVEGKGENLLMESGSLHKYDVLKAAHHGSKNSSSEPFLEIVRPYVTLMSAGKNNRYGHPHAETLKRLEAAESRVYSTQENGAVTVWTDGKTMEIRAVSLSTLVKTGAFPI